MKKINNYNKEFLIYSINMAKIFYKDINESDFQNITDDRILFLKKLAPNLLEKEFTSSNKFINYIKKMKRLVNDPQKYNIENQVEKYILFMFSVDPSFEAIKIYGESNHIEEVKEKMKKYFGIYDTKLINIENYFIKHLLKEEKIKEINEEIERRVFS